MFFTEFTFLGDEYWKIGNFPTADRIDVHSKNHTLWSVPEFGWILRKDGEDIQDDSIQITGKYKPLNSRDEYFSVCSHNRNYLNSLMHFKN